MKSSILTMFLYGASIVAAAPQIQRDSTNLIAREAAVEPVATLEKRKGGGGGGGRGGGSSSGGSSSGGRSSGGSSSGGSSSGSTGRGSSSSNIGGSTKTGSGTARSFGGKYAGGATVPYKAGGASPTRKIQPYVIGGAVGGFGAYYALPWIYPVYGYGYPIGYSWNANGRNHTTNVTCLCQHEQTCGCDPDSNSTFLAQILTNGTNGAPVNSTLVRTVEFANGTAISYINGSLANGTTAPGGSEDAFTSAAAKLVTSYGGYGVMMATVVAGMMVL